MKNFEGSIHVGVSLPFILPGQEVSFLEFLTCDPSVIWNTDIGVRKKRFHCKCISY